MAKRGAQGAGSIRKKVITRNGKEYTYWEARYTVGTDPGTGKQLQRTITGKTQKEVSQKLKKATSEIDDGIYIEPSKLTLGRWLDIWTSEYMGDKKFLTVKTYKAQVEEHIKPALGAVKLSELNPHDIQKFYNALLKEGRTIRKKDKGGEVVIERRPLAAKSVRNVHGILTKALAQAMALGYIRTNPATVVSLPRVEKKEIQPLTDAQVKAFLEAVEHEEYSALFKTILFTGMRESEAIGLTWNCVDFKEGLIIINKQLQKRPKEAGGFVFAPLKNDKSRSIAPATFVMKILAEEKTLQAENRLRAGQAWEAWSNEDERKSALVFTNALGQHLQPQTVYNHFKKLAKEIGAPIACVHDLRHTYAVLSLQNGDDIKTVQSNLGHATAAFTLDIYGHVSERMKKDSSSRMQRYIENM